MAVKLTSDQKRAKKKKLKAKEASTRQLTARSAFKSVIDLSFLLTTDGPIDVAAVARKINNKALVSGGDVRPSPPALAAFYKREEFAAAKEITIQLTELFESAIENSFMTACCGRIYAFDPEDQSFSTSPLIFEQVVIEEMSIRESVNRYMWDVFDHKVFPHDVFVYFFGMPTPHSAMHFALVLNKAGDTEVFLVGQGRWIKIADPDGLERLVMFSKKVLAESMLTPDGEVASITNGMMGLMHLTSPDRENPVLTDEAKTVVECFFLPWVQESDACAMAVLTMKDRLRQEVASETAEKYERELVRSRRDREQAIAEKDKLQVKFEMLAKSNGKTNPGQARATVEVALNERMSVFF